MAINASTPNSNKSKKNQNKNSNFVESICQMTTAKQSCNNNNLFTTINTPTLPFKTPLNNIPVPSINNFYFPLNKLLYVRNLIFASNKTTYGSINFTLHGTVTVLILAAATSLLSYYQYFGKPITCISSSVEKQSLSLIEKFCWMDGSFSAFDNFSREHPSVELGRSYPGLKPVQIDDRIVYHRNYAWIYFVLLLQALLFYTPKYVWKNTESKYFSFLESLRNDFDLEFQTNVKINMHVKNLANVMTKGGKIFAVYFMCEIACLLNLLAQVFVTNILINGEFITLGIVYYRHYKQYKTSSRYNPLTLLFPRFVKCTYEGFGYSGSNEVNDVICVLNLNSVNEKIFLILWVWYIFLFAVACVTLIYTSYILFFPCLRAPLITNAWPFNNRLNTICSRNVGYFFVLKVLGETICTTNFVIIIGRLLSTHFDERANFYPSISHRVSYAMRKKRDDFSEFAINSCKTKTHRLNEIVINEKVKFR